VGGSNSPETIGEPRKIREMEREMIVQTLQDVHGNKSLAAKKLGISRRTLYRKLEEYHIDAP